MDLALTTEGNGDVQLGVDFTGILTFDIIENGEMTLQGTIGDATIENYVNYLRYSGDLSL